jgi:hypothetical protein
MKGKRRYYLRRTYVGLYEVWERGNKYCAVTVPAVRWYARWIANVLNAAWAKRMAEQAKGKGAK